MRCELARTAIPELADDQTVDSYRAHHVAQCLACQAELAQYRRLRRSIGQLRDVRPFADTAHVEEVIDAIDLVSVAHARRRVLAGRAAATLGGLAAASALVLAGRGLRGRVPGV